MSKRERIEDLGILSVHLHNLFHEDIFNEIERYYRRPKDAFDSFNSLDENQKEEFIRMIAYGLQNIHEKIAECSQIADGNNEES